MAAAQKFIVALALLSSVVASSISENELFEPAREPRTGGIIKSLLPFINFKIKNPFECRPGSVVSGNPVLGTCMSQYDCDEAGGKAEGECAAGYGKCCVLYANCGDTITRNRTYIISNTTTSGSCTYTINKEVLDFKTTNPVADAIGACQVRLDFEEFVLGQPDSTTSLCSDDTFEITNNQNTFGPICGENEGQHVYLPISPDSDTIATISINMASTSTVNREWRIRTTYIPCLSNMTAPPGCLQYFTEDTGVIESFNFMSTSTTLSQIGGLEYSACISEKSGSCGISFNPTTFHVSGATAAGNPGLGATTCGTTDYVAILAVGNDGAPTDTIYCGGTITNAPIETYARPFSIFVRTNDAIVAGDTSTGFSMSYSRLPC